MLATEAFQAPAWAWALEAAVVTVSLYGIAWAVKGELDERSTVRYLFDKFFDRLGAWIGGPSCPMCAGTGQHSNKTCPRCGGKGC